MAAWKEASVRNEGLKKRRPKNLPGQRLRLRVRLQRARQLKQREHLIAAKIGKIDKTHHWNS
jgi:hypothetical protein